MTIISLAIILLYINILRKNRVDSKTTFITLISITASVDILNLQGYFLHVFDITVKYSAVTNFILFIYIFYYLYATNMKIEKKIFFAGFFFLIMAFFSIGYELLAPYNGVVLNSFGDGSIGGWDEYMRGGLTKEHVTISYGMTIRAYIKLMLYTLIVMIIKSDFTKEDLATLLKCINRYLIPYILVGPIEMVIKNILSLPELPYQINGFLLGIVDGETTYIEPLLRGDWYALQGFAEEPSRYVVSLFVISLLLFIEMEISPINRRKRLMKYEIILLTTMMISGGLTSVWCIFILVIIMLDFKFKIYSVSMAKLIISCFLIGGSIWWIITIMPFFLSDDSYVGWRLEVTFRTVDYLFSGQIMPGIAALDSSMPRFVSIIDTFNNFLDRPILGLGLMVESAHGSTVNMLADYGILGSISWLVFMTVGKRNVTYDYFYFFIVGIVSGIAIIVSRTFATQFFCYLLLEFTSLYTNRSNKEVLFNE